MERDDKNDPTITTNPSATVPLQRSAAIDPDLDSVGVENLHQLSDLSIETMAKNGAAATVRQRIGSFNSSRRRHGSGDTARERDGESERKMFHKKFVLAIKLGKKAFKDREEKGRMLSSKPVPYARQHSEILLNGWDKLSPENLFVSLQAYRKKMRREDYIERLWEYRDRAPAKLALIDQFEFVPEGHYVDDNILEMLNNPFQISDEYLDNIEAAIESVKNVLESIDLIESLYPTSKSLTKELVQHMSENHQRRVSALNMWLNNTYALISAIKIAGTAMGVEKMSCVPWPFIEPVEVAGTPLMNSSVTDGDVGSTPESPSTAESDDSPGNSLNKRKVRFESGALSSSPSTSASQLTSPGTSGDSRHMFISTPFSTVDIQASPTSFYRPEVDRILRKSSVLDMIKSRSPALLRPGLKAKYAVAKLELEPVMELGHLVSPHVKHCDVLPLSSDGDVITADQKVQERDAMDGFFTLYPEWQSMKLPSIIPMFVFLARFPLDLTHECLRLRLEQHVDNPSLPIIRQVVHECSETAKVAISVKQSYQYILSPVTKKYAITDELFERNIERFNNDLKEIIEVYFGYVEYGMDTLKKETTAHQLKVFLEEEWSFCKEICPFITGGMAEASKRFCGMCSMLLQWIQNELEQELDRALFNSNPTVFLDSPCSPTNDPFCNIDSDMEHLTDDYCTTAHYRQMLIKTCREIKTLFTRKREWASKALGFAKQLRKDLEISAEFEVKIKSIDLMRVLQSTKHVRVIVPHTANYIILAPDCIKDDKQTLLALLDVTCGREDVAAEASREGYLLLSNTGEDANFWEGEVISVEPKTETTIALSHIGVRGLFLIVAHSSLLSKQRKTFCEVTRDAVELVNEQTTCHQAIAEAWSDLRANAFELAKGVKTAIEHVENQLDSTDLQSLDTDADRKTVKSAYKETLHQCYSFGFEFLQEFNRVAAGCGQKKNEILLSFAEQWIKFVLHHCERGKGTRPRWANPGFDFLSIVIEPSITKFLSDEKFEQLQKDVEEVVKHIIGSSVSGSASMSGSLHTLNKPVSDNHPQRYLSVDGLKSSRQLSTGSNSSSGSKRGVASEPGNLYDRTDSWRSVSSGQSMSSIPGILRRRSGERYTNSPLHTHEGPNYSTDMCPPERAQAAVNLLDHKRDDDLRKKQVIGRVVEGQPHVNVVKINVKRVNFKWQRGVKIGEGAFGKVYTAINVDTNCMMAMKELRFQPNDVQTIKSIADELKTFEGIHHPNLVKYFGIEVHKEEIYIFMEYCNEGTLEEMSKIGLTESLIRRYTRELVIAIEYLHEHNIIHRDIKGANIFLVCNDKLKLGDFGCSAKLKDHTTFPGEMVAMVGTAAFMAPEVVTNKGYGRSADVWSLGCVVVEMVTGKRPWHEMENMHQIMFKVGMGNIPTIPENFHQEGIDFLSRCFQVEPSDRSTASELRGDTFLKIQ
ncbi:mitogen-activated protein kinase kinase kinase 4-like isoform X2 [Watersipora subatra]|uniref:mitogen-activated protein kinase kinase kinase 4-like isoform X2 n=1 Tax=Watersipora subatra TaxID=2589382 RepID=UPI00355C46AE